MNCWHCQSYLIWGGDDEDESGEFSIVSNLSCPKCESFILVYYPRNEDDDE